MDFVLFSFFEDSEFLRVDIVILLIVKNLLQNL